MKEQKSYFSWIAIVVAVCLTIAFTLPGHAESNAAAEGSGPGPIRGPTTPALCKDTSALCPIGPIPYGYLLSLPHDSPINNETELFQSIPGAVFVSKFNRVDNTWQRWDGTKCCKSSKMKFGVVTDCQTTGPGGCFLVDSTLGEGYGVVVNGPSRYTILGADASSNVSLLQTSAGSQSGNNLVALPYCSALVTARNLMDSIGFARVASVARYLSSTDSLQIYTGRGPGGNFNLTTGEAYMVRMNTTTNYDTVYTPGCPVQGCGGCGPDGTNCDDGNLCTSGDQCMGGACAGESILSTCDDNIPETVDSCNGCAGGCANAVDPCAVPVVNGTVELPPDCGYITGADLHDLIDGLPSGTEVHVSPIHGNFTVITATAARGPTAVASTETFDSDLFMRVTGTGILASVNCELRMTPVHVVVESQPAQPFQPIQDFDTDMKSLTGELASDSTCNLFQSLKVTAGTDHGLPSPGHVHLKVRDDGNYDVATFFSVNVTMDFVGKGLLDGYSGSTTQVVVMGPPTTIPVGATLIDSVVPVTKLLPPGTSHTVTLVLSDIVGQPITGRSVGFAVTSGPNMGAAGTCSPDLSCATDLHGRVSLTYTSNGAFGTDQIQVCPSGGTCSTVSVEWACTTDPPNSPTEVGNNVHVDQNNGTTEITWGLASGSTRSDVLRGDLAALPVGPGNLDEICLDNLAGTLTPDGQDPAPGAGFWYLVRGDNACGGGPWGFQVQGGVSTARTSTTCP